MRLHFFSFVFLFIFFPLKLLYDFFIMVNFISFIIQWLLFSVCPEESWLLPHCVQAEKVHNQDLYFKKAVKYVGEPMSHLESIASSAVCFLVALLKLFGLLSSVHIWLVICVFSFFSSRALCNMLLEWIEGKMGKYFLRNFPFSKVKFSLAFLPYLSLVFPLYLDSPRACLSHTFHCYRCIFEFA